MKQSARSWRLVLLVAAAVGIVVPALAVVWCGGSSTGSASGTPAPAISGFTAVPKSADTILGAGASFPAPLYMKWGSDYNCVAGVKLNYQSIGSGGGISAIEAKTVDFGASDAPLEEADLKSNGLVQFTMVVGGVVVVVNLDGVADGQLKLNADVLAGIYMGAVTTLNDSAIAKVNPGVKLPSTKINVVHRSDG